MNKSKIKLLLSGVMMLAVLSLFAQSSGYASAFGEVRLVCGSNVSNKVPLLVYALDPTGEICYGSSGAMSLPSVEHGTGFSLSQLPANREIVFVFVIESLNYFSTQKLILKVGEEKNLGLIFVRCNEGLSDIPFQEMFLSVPTIIKKGKNDDFLNYLYKKCK